MQNSPALSELAAMVWNEPAPRCAWCHSPINPRDKTTVLVAGGNGLHPQCDGEFQSSGDSAFGMNCTDGIAA